MLLQAWTVLEEAAAWTITAVVGIIVVTLLLAGSRGLAGRGGMPASIELLAGLTCFAAVSAIGRQASALGAAPWQAALVCVLAGLAALPLVAWLHGRLARRGLLARPAARDADGAAE
jgi:hypothetical protein